MIQLRGVNMHHDGHNRIIPIVLNSIEEINYPLNGLASLIQYKGQYIYIISVV